MDKIVVLGAGKSSGILLEHLARQTANTPFRLFVADADPQNLEKRVLYLSQVETFCGNLSDPVVLRNLLHDAKAVVSLLPPSMHLTVALCCLDLGVHMFTASYTSAEIKALHVQALSKGILILMECGLDPGLDHMSAMRMIDKLKNEGAQITGFRSFCGGLVAPVSDNNPWGYKITWNPRNVVLAGQGTAQYLDGGEIKYIPYHQLFKRIQPLTFEGYGEYEAYANRDSISYINLYGLQSASVFLRGTIRKKGFCNAWHQLIQLGLTDDTVQLPRASSMTVQQWVEKFVPASQSITDYLGLSPQSEEWTKLNWLGITGQDTPFQRETGTSAEFLQALLEQKWALSTGDRDLVLMQHQVDVKGDDGNSKTIYSTLVLEGQDETRTAMAKTVGLPLAVALLQFLQGNIKIKGVQVPVTEEIYLPILEEVQKEGIIFRE